MPEIVSCLAYGKETYASLSTCPHCRQPLKFETNLSRDGAFQPEIPFHEFVALHRDGDMAVKLNNEAIDSQAFYPFAPRYYSLEMLVRLYLFLQP